MNVRFADNFPTVLSRKSTSSASLETIILASQPKATRAAISFACDEPEAMVVPQKVGTEHPATRSGAKISGIGFLGPAFPGTASNLPPMKRVWAPARPCIPLLDFGGQES